MKKKRTMFLMITLALIVGLIGTSYAYFTGVFESNKTEESNTLNTETLSDTVMISDAEDSAGSFTASSIYPGHKEVASIKVNVTGKQNSKIGIKFIYDVEENGLNNHIKISIYKSKKKIETKENYFNCKTIINTESETAKYYETCEEKDLELLIGEKTLHGGKEELDVVTDTIMITEEGSTEEYYYYAVVEFINIENSQNEDMDKVLKGKINVEVAPPEKKTFEESVVAYGKLGNNIADSILYSAYLDQENLLYDETIDNNLRYVGSSPNNYVLFNDELWRVIGVMNNVEDASGMKDSRTKLIRDESIGEFSWDTSPSSINNGYGVNEWSQAKIMKLMNPGYESESIGGSLYWNRTSGKCYNGQSNATAECNFNDSGLSETSKEMIESIVWNLGANSTNNITNNGNAIQYYGYERSKNTGKVCPYSNLCNDNISRTTRWIGKVALLNPSDYGFSSNKEGCHVSSMFQWNSTCIENGWMSIPNTRQWLITPFAIVSGSRHVTNISETGILIDGNSACKTYGIKLVISLKINTKIIKGNGTKENPYILEMN